MTGLKDSLFETLFENSPDAIIVLDSDLRIRIFSRGASALLGYSPKDVLEKNVRSLLVDKDHQEFDGLLASARETGVVKNSKFHLLTSQGAGMRLFLTVRSLLSRSGCAGYYMLMSVASTEEWSAFKDPQIFQAALKRLRHLSSVGQLTSAFAHDIKSPLHVILSTAELLADMQKQDENVKTSLSLITRNARRAAKIVKTLLEFSKTGACRLRPGNLNDVINDCVELLDSSIKQCHGVLVKELGEIPRAFLDSHYLQGVIYNLFTNALEALPKENGKITVRTQWLPSDKCIRLTVTDNGKGVDPWISANLFQPFFTTRESGTGLGLYLARQIMNDHSASITLESSSGKGTKVTLIFTRMV